MVVEHQRLGTMVVGPRGLGSEVDQQLQQILQKSVAHPHQENREAKVCGKVVGHFVQSRVRPERKV